MKKITIYLTFLSLTLAAFLAFWGCNRNKEYLVPSTWTVFPLDSGKFRMYEAFDTTWTNVGTKEGTHYYRKEVIGEKIGFENRMLTKLYSYVTPDAVDTLGFALDRVWMLYKDTTQYAELIKENVRELVLRYPAYVDSTYMWDPYLFADTQEGHILRYRYQTLDSTVHINNMTFEHCVVVMESSREDSLSVTNYRKAYTVYAPNVGKIIRYYKQVNKSGNIVSSEKSAVHIERLISHN